MGGSKSVTLGIFCFDLIDGLSKFHIIHENQI